MFTSAFLLATLLPAGAEARAYQTQFYNPNIYSRTRQTMSNRAAARAADRAAAAKRARSRRGKPPAAAPKARRQG